MAAPFLFLARTLEATTTSIPHVRDLTTHEALSGIFGSISLATWIFLLVPQLILNYKTGSAEGISLAFLTVWLVGDVASLAGALWANLVPTVIALGIYFCLADFTLIAQCLYYNHINSTRGRQASTTSATSNTLDENSPLLSRERTNSSIGLPGSHRRRRTTSSASAGSGEGARDVLGKILDDEFGPQGSAATWRYNALCILGVCVAGAVGWVCAWRAGVWTPTPEPGPERAAQGDEMDMAVGAQVLGYFSALCYLGARIPQIVKNWREKSCEGLALLFFLLSLLGNATYGAGILFHSQDKQYLLKNLPWLIGSLGTMAEDGLIFWQFRVYGAGREAGSAVLE